jgi:hypothetical protein
LNLHYFLTAEGSWRNSEFVCAFADTDRHLGHLIKKKNKWHAYDATHSDEAAKGYKFLGAFVDLASAKQTVELAVAVARLPRAMEAGGSFIV